VLLRCSKQPVYAVFDNHRCPSLAELLQSMDYTAPPALRKSDALHERVLAFAHSFETQAAGAYDTFENLALDIARFQYDHSPGFARLCAVPRAELTHLEHIPTVPSDVFRLARVALHPPELDTAIFRTSGTTSELTGQHPVRRLATKERLAILQAQRTLFAQFGRGVIVALATRPDGSSSLGHMMELFMRHFDGRPLVADPHGATWSSSEPGRFLIDARGVDIEGLERAARLAKFRSEPLYVLATSFAMVAALDALDGATIHAPARTTIMITGGFKGRSRHVDEDHLRSAIAQAFGIAPERIVGEYGMTELSSQLFEQAASVSAARHGDARLSSVSAASSGTSPRSAWWQEAGPAGVYFPPPWLRVRAVSPQSYQEVPSGEVGLAHFTDLANIDSCLSVLTQDQVRCIGGGIQLLGRAPKAPPRGCSLPFEALAFATTPAKVS